MDLLIALVVGLASGFLNVVAGGGTLIVFPTLVALGLSPLVANVTAAVGVFPGSLAGSWTYRKILSLLVRYVRVQIHLFLTINIKSLMREIMFVLIILEHTEDL